MSDSLAGTPSLGLNVTSAILVFVPPKPEHHSLLTVHLIGCGVLALIVVVRDRLDSDHLVLVL